VVVVVVVVVVLVLVLVVAVAAAAAFLCRLEVRLCREPHTGRYHTTLSTPQSERLSRR